MIKNKNLSLNIKLEYSTDLNIPTYNVEDTGNIFTLESSIVVSGYMGEATDRLNITKIDMQFSLENTDNSVITDTESFPITPKKAVSS